MPLLCCCCAAVHLLKNRNPSERALRPALRLQGHWLRLSCPGQVREKVVSHVPAGRGGLLGCQQLHSRPYGGRPSSCKIKSSCCAPRSHNLRYTVPRKSNQWTFLETLPFAVGWKTNEKTRKRAENRQRENERTKATRDSKQQYKAQRCLYLTSVMCFHVTLSVDYNTWCGLSWPQKYTVHIRRITITFLWCVFLSTRRHPLTAHPQQWPCRDSPSHPREVREYKL